MFSVELLQLRYFKKVAELQSITKAANHFKIPQPSMSQTISRLEKELGIQLFDRRNSKLFLNDHGQLFLFHVEKVLQDLDNGIAAVTEKAQIISGPVKIKIMENHRFILTCIPKFTKLYPEVCISASHGYYEDQDVTYDLCVSSRLSYNHLTAYVPLIRERLVLAVHEDHPLARETSVTAAALKGEKLISLPSQSALHTMTYDLCRSHGFEPQMPIICDDPYFIRKYVDEGMGIALAPELSWKGRFREKTVLIPLENPPIYISSYLLWDNTRYSSVAVREFRDYLLSEAQKISE